MLVVGAITTPLGGGVVGAGVKGILAAAKGTAKVAKGTAEVAAGAASTGRGINEFGGVVSETGTNAAGGRIFTSTGTITQNDFAGIINSQLMQGNKVHILTGAHGFPNGTMKPDASLFDDDVAKFGKFPGVSVHDVPAMSSDEISAVLRQPGAIIGGFCNSGACLAPNM